MFFNKGFILASSSQSRYKILKNNKLFFKQMNPSCNESFFKKKLIKNMVVPSKISLELARIKSKSISIKKPKDLVVGCDTIVSVGGVVLSKAKNLKDAKKKIMNFSGKTHYIYSSASVFLNKKEIWRSTEKSTIKIRRLTEKEVDEYLLKTKKKILTSVGCYQVESLGPNIIEGIKGDFFNVMGFPLFPFLIFLKNYMVKK